ncbi:MAG: 4Fe-4S binding protein [Bacillota bacterium]
MKTNNNEILKIEFLGIELNSPYIVGSGPISYGAPGIIRAHNAGAGAIVTKTIRDNSANNPYPHIAKNNKDSLINAEKWADLPGEDYINKEIPEAVEAGAVVIASIGHTPEEVCNWIEGVVNAGASMVELVSYQQETMLDMVERAVELVDIPVIVKLSPNWPDPIKTAKAAVKRGAAAITAMDSIGPVLRVDINTGKPVVAGEGGRGWLTGSAIRPIAQAMVADLKAELDVPVIGLGGVIKAEDAVEMMMVGADAVGVCSTLIIHGSDHLLNLQDNLIEFLNNNNYKHVSELTGLSNKYLNQKEKQEIFTFNYIVEKCIDCQKCVLGCSYNARKLEDKKMELDNDLCRYCGFCASVCPTGALEIIEEAGKWDIQHG